MRHARLALLLAATALLLPSIAAAHGRSISYSSWKFSGDGAWVTVRIPRIELTRLQLDPIADLAARGQIGQLLAESIRLTGDGIVCEPTAEPLARGAPEGWVVYAWRVRCPSPGALVLSSRLLLDVAPSHLHFARVMGFGEGVLERVLSEAEPLWALQSPEAAEPVAGTSFESYLSLGVGHILSGWDHLAFLLALLLLATTLRQVVALVTSFTVAHSVTLGLAVLGVVRPEAAAVEALIGFSIALVAAENGWLLGGRGRMVPAVLTLGLLGMAGAAAAGIGAISVVTLLGLAAFTAAHFGLLRGSGPAAQRAAVAFAFGLVHGFGFAGVLAELELPAARLVPALFGFNLGVELGQLGVVVLIWPALLLLGRVARGRLQSPVAEIGSAAVCGLGLFWFVSRTYGG